MAYHKLGETDLSGLGTSNQFLAHGVHGIPAAANFFDQEGSAYTGELEDALMQGVVSFSPDGDRKPFFAARPSQTLEIFPSWLMSFQQTPRGNSELAESTDSGSAHNATVSAQLDPESPMSRMASGRPPERKQQEMARVAPRTGTATANCHPPKLQDKRKLTTKDGKPLDAKTLRRLAQNREAARKSRVKKKVYVQQLETSRIKLTRLEQDLQRARSEGIVLRGSGSSSGNTISSGAARFDMEYARWLEEDHRHMSELRRCLQARLQDGDLRVVVDDCLVHYDDIFRLKGAVATSDAFHLITGAWTTPAERCFLWMGGFRPSEILKILTPQLDPLTEQQLLEICSLQQSTQEAEEALSQGLEQLQQSLVDSIASCSLYEGTNVGSFMGQMAIAVDKLSNLEGLVRQADNLRQLTLHQMRTILTIRQAARCFLAIGEYNSRLRALSSLWASRPRENLIANENECPTTGDLLVQQSSQNQFAAF
uniref:Transcription factor HBP-1b(C1) n=1 Tax=Anthurium amnicola TaxID=1678845 RepID=A0A1D1XNC9_9ARAE